MKTYHKRKQNRRRNTKKNRKNRSKKGGGDGDTDIAYGFNNIENMNNKKDGFLNKISGVFNRLYNTRKDIDQIKTTTENAKEKDKKLSNYKSKKVGLTESLGKSNILRNNNRNVSKLGEGGFGSVEIWENKSSIVGEIKLYAVKIQPFVDTDDIHYKIAINEAKILSFLKTDNKCLENILCFKGIYIDDSDDSQKKIFLATDYDQNYTSLNVLLKQYNDNYIQYSEKLIQIIYQIRIAIDYIHSIKIYHNDLKPDNILCNLNTQNIGTILIKDIKIKLIDFGLFCDNKIKNCTLDKKGTYDYMHPLPELLKADEESNTKFIPKIESDKKYTKFFEFKLEFIDFDKWSFGMIILKFFGKNINFLDTTLIDKNDTPDYLNDILKYEWNRIMALRIFNIYIFQIILQNIESDDFKDIDIVLDTKRHIANIQTNHIENIKIILNLSNPQYISINDRIEKHVTKIYNSTFIPKINNILKMKIQELLLFPRTKEP